MSERTLADGHIGRCESALAREVQASRKLIADLRALHDYREGYHLNSWCDYCHEDWPCSTIRMIDEAGL